MYLLPKQSLELSECDMPQDTASQDESPTGINIPGSLELGGIVYEVITKYSLEDFRVTVCDRNFSARAPTHR